MCDVWALFLVVPWVFSNIAMFHINLGSHAYTGFGVDVLSVVVPDCIVLHR